MCITFLKPLAMKVMHTSASITFINSVVRSSVSMSESERSMLSREVGTY